MNERYILDNLPAEVSFDKFIAQIMLTEEEDIAYVRGLFTTALSLSRPKAVYRVCYIDKIEGENVTLSDDACVFKSRVLARNLEGIHRVFAYVVSCGTELNDFVHSQDDPIVQIWFDMFKQSVLGCAIAGFREHISKKHGIEKLSSMAPGSGNIDTWQIQQQRPLFALIGDVEADIGVALTPSLLMEPNKSVSGIMFPSDKGYVSCELCRRENCVGRHAPYNAAADV